MSGGGEGRAVGEGVWVEGLEGGCGAVEGGEIRGSRARKSFFQKTLEARRGASWRGRGRGGPGPATGGRGCGAGGQRGVTRRESAVCAGEGGRAAGSRRLGARKSPHRIWTKTADSASPQERGTTSVPLNRLKPNTVADPRGELCVTRGRVPGRSLTPGSSPGQAPTLSPRRGIKTCLRRGSTRGCGLVDGRRGAGAGQR